MKPGARPKLAPCPGSAAAGPARPGPPVPPPSRDGHEGTASTRCDGSHRCWIEHQADGLDADGQGRARAGRRARQTDRLEPKGGRFFRGSSAGSSWRRLRAATAPTSASPRCNGSHECSIHDRRLRGLRHAFTLTVPFSSVKSGPSSRSSVSRVADRAQGTTLEQCSFEEPHEPPAAWGEPSGLQRAFKGRHLATPDGSAGGQAIPVRE